MPRRVLLMVVGVALALGAQDLQAQACSGNPLERGSWGAMVGVSEGEGFADFGLGVSANVVDDFYADLRYARTHFDAPVPNGNFLSAGLAYQVMTGAAYVCPNLSLQRAWYTYEAFGEGVLSGWPVQTSDVVHASTVGLPLSVSVGAPFGTLDGSYFIPSIGAGVFFTRATYELYRFPINSSGQQIAQAYQEEVSTSDTYGFAGAGITLGYRMVFLSGGLSMTTAEGAEPVASLGLGLVF